MMKRMQIFYIDNVMIPSVPTALNPKNKIRVSDLFYLSLEEIIKKNP